MKYIRVAALVLLYPALLVAPRFYSQDAPATASIEGVVLQLGTNTPISGVDVELSRVEGTSAAPLAPGAGEAFAAVLSGASPGLVGGATPAPVLAPEVKYAKS